MSCVGGGERGNGLIVDVDEEDGATGARDGGVGEEVAREAEEKRHGRLQHGQIVQLEDGEEDEGRSPLEGEEECADGFHCVGEREERDASWRAGRGRRRETPPSCRSDSTSAPP